VPDLTETSIRYLFATSWLPCDPAQQLVRVPGGSTTGLDTGGNLLHIATWNLRRQGLMEFEQLREVDNERVTVLGGRSFARFKLLQDDAKLRGLEGALLDAARSVERGDGPIAKALDRITDEDEHGVRLLIGALDLDNRSPWGTVCSHCFAEASAENLVEAKGRLFRKVVITDPGAVESLRERHEELRAARGAYLDAEPELTNAVISDCLQVVLRSFNPSLGD
jgi:hypothetical protein